MIVYAATAPGQPLVFIIVNPVDEDSAANEIDRLTLLGYDVAETTYEMMRRYQRREIDTCREEAMRQLRSSFRRLGARG